MTPEVYGKVKKFAEYAALEVVACPVAVIARIAWLFWPGVGLAIALLTYGSPILVGLGFVGERLSIAVAEENRERKETNERRQCSESGGTKDTRKKDETKEIPQNAPPPLPSHFTSLPARAFVT